jgi:hypothetical protein
MAKVKYHGEFPEGKDAITQHGYEFSRDGSAVEVKEEGLLSKFASNRFFEVSGASDKEEVKQGQAEAENAEAETLKAWLTEHRVPFHHRAGLDKLRSLKADYEKAQEKAQEA